MVDNGDNFGDFLFAFPYVPTETGSTLKDKNFLPRGEILSHYRVDKKEKTNNFERVASSESISVPLKFLKITETAETNAVGMLNNFGKVILNNFMAATLYFKTVTIPFMDNQIY